MNQENFLQTYLSALTSLSGWFSPDAAVMFVAYNQLIARQGIAANTLEIGVHHGKSAALIAALRGKNARFTAIDLFEELQSANISGSGHGNKSLFLDTMKRFYSSTDFIDVIASSSVGLSACHLFGPYSFCHIDGGHSREETYNDLLLCSEITLDHGLIALDDYFNPYFPGVSEGAVKFALEFPGTLTPIAIGYNKVLFQRRRNGDDLNQQFASSFPFVPKSTVNMWETPAYLFDAGVSIYFNVDESSIDHLVQGSGMSISITIEPLITLATARPASFVILPILLHNRSKISLPSRESPSLVGLSYHLLSDKGEVIQWDNERFYFDPPLEPDEQRIIDLKICSPSNPGRYLLEIDVIWENVMWLKTRGNEPGLISLEVTPGP